MEGILYLHTDMFAEREAYERAMEIISADRKKKIEKLKVAQSARLSLGAGILLRLAMERCSCLEKIDAISYGKYGKPFLQNTNFYFSLTHSGAYAVCAYADFPVGADLQKIKSEPPKHTKKIFSKEENTFFSSLDEKQKAELFFQLWSRKESLLKWDGRGLHLPMSEISLIAEKSFTDSICFEGKKLYFRDYDFLQPAYAFSVCSEKSFSAVPEEITSIFLTKN